MSMVEFCSPSSVVKNKSQGDRAWHATAKRLAVRESDAFLEAFPTVDRSARRSCPNLAKPSWSWAQARAMKAR